jgi:hypothetical protein
MKKGIKLKAGCSCKACRKTKERKANYVSLKRAERNFFRIALSKLEQGEDISPLISKCIPEIYC